MVWINFFLLIMASVVASNNARDVEERGIKIFWHVLDGVFTLAAIMIIIQEIEKLNLLSI